MGDESVPKWVEAFFLLLGMGAIVVVMYAVKRGRRDSRSSNTRLYGASPATVRAVALATIERLQCQISYIDDQSISFGQRMVAAEAVATFPVIHMTILPMETGGTEVILLGAKSRFNYTWHFMAQGFLKQLDQDLAT